MPNPARDVATIQFYAEAAFAYRIEIADIRGKILRVQKGNATEGTNVQRINVQSLTQGEYLINIINDRGQKQTSTLIKF